MKSKHKLSCPKCNKMRHYKRFDNYTYAIKHNTVCHSCAKIGLTKYSPEVLTNMGIELQSNGCSKIIHVCGHSFNYKTLNTALIRYKNGCLKCQYDTKMERYATNKKLNNQLWAQIPNQPKYFISHKGLVISRDGNLLKHQIVSNQKRAAVRIFNKQYPMGKLYYVSRLLAETFIENPNNCRYVSFKDTNKDNISIDNLFWTNKIKQ